MLLSWLKVKEQPNVKPKVKSAKKDCNPQAQGHKAWAPRPEEPLLKLPLIASPQDTARSQCQDFPLNPGLMSTHITCSRSPLNLSSCLPMNKGCCGQCMLACSCTHPKGGASFSSFKDTTAQQAMGCWLREHPETPFRGAGDHLSLLRSAVLPGLLEAQAMMPP